MKEKTLKKEFLQYTGLNICGMLGLSCYILADTFFVSKGLGADGLTALNLAIPIYSFVHGTGLMLGMGGATKYSVWKGQQNGKAADEVYSETVYAMAAFSMMFMVIGVLFSGILTSLLGANREVFSMTKTYLQVILLYAPAFIANNVLLCFVRNDGNPGLSMTAMLVGSASNIILDYVFIFPLHMGIFGAALATGCAPVISLGVLSVHWTARKNQFRFIRFKPSLKSVANIMSLGVPSLITEVASGVVMIVFNMIILNIMGNIGIAAYGVVANLSLVAASIYTGVAQGTQPMFSRFYGCGDSKSSKRTLGYAINMTLLISAVIYLLLLLAANPVVGIFNREQNGEMQRIAESGLKYYFAAVPFVGFNTILCAYFTSGEKALPAQIISLARGIFVIVPSAFLMSFFFGMTGVWLSYPLAEGIVAVVGMVLYYKEQVVEKRKGA